MMLLVSSLANGQTIANQLINLNFRTNSNITNKTIYDKVRPDSTGVVINAVSKFAKNIYDSLRSASGSGADSSVYSTRFYTNTRIADSLATMNLQRVTSLGATTTNQITVGSSGKSRIESRAIWVSSDAGGSVNNVRIASFNDTGLLYLRDGSGSYATTVQAIHPTQNNSIWLKNGTGTLAFTSDLTGGTVTSITPGYGFTSTTPITSTGTLTIDSTKYVTVAANNTAHGLNWRTTGNATGTNTVLVGGTTDSNDVKTIVNNITVDSIDRVNKIDYKGSVNESVLQLRNRITYAGAFQTNNLIAGVGTGSFYSANLPYVQFGGSSPNFTTNMHITSSDFSATSLQFHAVTSTNSPMTFIGAGSAVNAPNALQFSFGTWAGSGNVSATSGTLNQLTLCTMNGANGGFAPSSGTCARYAVNDVGTIAMTSTASGNTASFTNAGLTLTSVANGSYSGVYLTNNTSFGIYQTGTAKNSYAGNTILGGTSDDGNRLQVYGNAVLETAGNHIIIKGGTNAAIGTATLSSGTVTISTTAICAACYVQLTAQSCVSCGSLSIGTRVTGTSFVINSTNALDASSVLWEIKEIAP